MAFTCSEKWDIGTSWCIWEEQSAMAGEHSTYTSSLLDYQTNKGNSNIDWLQLVKGEESY